MGTAPYWPRISGYSAKIPVGMANTVSRARYLPITMLPTDTGAVSRSWSVFWRFSSAKVRMVSAGQRNTRKKLTELRT